jgi:hypothetical protein
VGDDVLRRPLASGKASVNGSKPVILVSQQFNFFSLMQRACQPSGKLKNWLILYALPAEGAVF